LYSLRIRASNQKEKGMDIQSSGTMRMTSKCKKGKKWGKRGVQGLYYMHLVWDNKVNMPIWSSNR